MHPSGVYEVQRQAKQTISTFLLLFTCVYVPNVVESIIHVKLLLRVKHFSLRLPG